LKSGATVALPKAKLLFWKLYQNGNEEIASSPLLSVTVILIMPSASIAN
jgi:hypothetical protein